MTTHAAIWPDDHTGFGDCGCDACMPPDCPKVETAATEYDAGNPTAFTEDECRAAVGKKASITLTGYIVDYGTSDTGPFVKFQPADRFGFGDFRFGIDLDALEVTP